MKDSRAEMIKKAKYANVYHEEYPSYVDGMNDLVTVLTDEKVKNYISAYRDAVIDYKLIFEILQQ